ncbi:THO complex subunit 6 homolog [Halichondria panicea]|uniref:THO complex subunit 6 homolog n=1 Tax=Halichondria panicea TaxID=6063 RepID=UPI00312B5C57
MGKLILTRSTWPWMEEMSNHLEQYYNIVFDQIFSPNTKHLVTCDRYGRLAVFSLAAALGASADNGKSPVLTTTGGGGPAYCLETAGQLLFSGGEEGIQAWKWSDLTKTTNKTIEPVATLSPPARQHVTPDTNALVYDEATETLYSGCGDNNVYGWDIATGQIKTTLSGHDDYVHCLCSRAGGQLLSGAEDGTVRLWDPARENKTVHTIHKGGRSEWVGCVGVDSGGEWIVCGGSEPPSIYHLSTLSHVTTLATPPGVITQAILFTNDRIITAGSERLLRHWSISGDSMATIPSAHSHAFSLAHNKNSQQYEMWTVSGDSSELQVFTNLGYKAFSLTL